ncbi:MAG: hypothetical protein H0T79_05695 [Deltaproteobacteria bacterium]|nr:hypothetical protein [Deltaproteobacteria bacterium]
MLAVLAIGTGCPTGGSELGERCDVNSDCDRTLQCLTGTCIPRCQRAPDCGDGYACDAGGFCHLATGQQGDACVTEVACAPGLSCQIDGGDGDGLLSSCTAQNAGHPAGSRCGDDADCRNGTCALGHCVDLCADTRDCGGGLACMNIPRVEAGGRMFAGCLPSRGTLTWSIPVIQPTQTIQLPIPDAATAVSVTMNVDDVNQLVGATRLTAPREIGSSLPGMTLLTTCGEVGPVTCDPIAKAFGNIVRHRPGFAQSVLAMPSRYDQSTPHTSFPPGAYDLTVSSLRMTEQAGLIAGSAIPRVTAVVKLDSSVILDLHFYFLDLTDHPCEASLGSPKFNAELARTSAAFQDDFLGSLRGTFAQGGVAIGSLTYDDLTDHPDLDGLDVADAASLLALGRFDVGVNVFFVRTLSPVGLQAIGPNPGPAGLANTRQSGIVIGVDSLCYRSWTELSRLTAHELARYMGLYHNVEVVTDPQGRPYGDPIADSDASDTNLMFFSEFGGTELSPGQREILTRSPVLR